MGFEVSKWTIVPVFLALFMLYAVAMTFESWRDPSERSGILVAVPFQIGPLIIGYYYLRLPHTIEWRDDGMIALHIGDPE